MRHGLNIGIDVDGCLAGFNEAFISTIFEVTGKQLPAVSDTFPDVWDYHKPHLTEAETKAVWERINQDMWLLGLGPLPGTAEVLSYLNFLRRCGANVYFITARRVHLAKIQTEIWLSEQGAESPTVLTGAGIHDKGPLARALKLDVFIDDRPENCFGVLDAMVGSVTPCEVYLVDAPYNRGPHVDRRVIRVNSVLEAVTQLMKTTRTWGRAA